MAPIVSCFCIYWWRLTLEFYGDNKVIHFHKILDELILAKWYHLYLISDYECVVVCSNIFYDTAKWITAMMKPIVPNTIPAIAKP